MKLLEFPFLRKDYRVDAKNGWVYVGFGQDLKSGDMGKIYWEKPQNQGIVFGASGSGKSVFVARKTYEDILSGYQSFNVDPKGSKDWLEAFLKACHRLGVLYDKERGPIILALPYPDISFKFNPLQGLDPHQIAFVVASGIPESREPFWWNISYEITLVIALALKARGINQITFGDIYDYLTAEKLEELRAKILADVSHIDELKLEAERTLQKLTTYDPRFYSEVNSSLRTYLTRLITGTTGKVINVRVQKNLLRDRLEAGELRFFAFLNAEAMKQVAYDVARILFAWLLTYVGEKSGELRIVEPQLRVNIDELTEVGFHEINKAVRLVRERNVSVFMLTQSPSGLKSAFKQNGDAVVRDIINSCDLRIFFRMNEPQDCDYVSSMSPEVERPRAIIHKKSISITYQKGYLVEPFDLQELRPGFGYAFLDGTVYYFYSPPHKDRLKVKVVWTDEPEKEKADVVVNMKELASNYLPYDEKDLLVVLMSELRENWKVGKHYEFDDPDLIDFYEKTRKFVQVYKEDYLKMLDFVQLLKNVSSVVRGGGVLKNVSLLDHSLRAAMTAYEMVKDAKMEQEEKERVFLAALGHDFGKAVVTKKNYTKKDHVLATRQVLSDLGIDPEIVKLAASHHDSAEDMLSDYVRVADHGARQEEEEMHTRSEGEGEEIKKKLLETVRMEGNASPDKIVSDNNFVYVSKDKAREILGDLSMEEMEKITGGQFVEVRIRKKGHMVVPSGIYLKMEVPEDIMNEIKSRRMRLQAGLKVEEINS